MIYKHQEGVLIDDFKQVLKEYKMSIIEWRTGTPIEEGGYLVTTSDNQIKVDRWSAIFKQWDTFDHEDINISVVAWCPLREIKPVVETNLLKKD